MNKINPANNARTIHEYNRQIADLETEIKACRVKAYSLFEQQTEILALIKKLESE